MQELQQNLERLNIPCEVNLPGQWARLTGRCPVVYIVHSAQGDGYVVICICPERHPARRFPSAAEAIAYARGEEDTQTRVASGHQVE